MKIALNGATGFVGTHIRKIFTDYVVIGRNDSEEQILKKLQGVQVVINLAGAPIIKKWTESYKKTLVTSRVESTKKIVSAINKSDVEYFVSTSAIGIYPDGKAYDESFSEYNDDFLTSLALEWEAEALKCTKPTSILRFGVILGKDGGALAQMLIPFKLGLGGIIGNGKMMMSWIDIDDLMGIYKHIIDKRSIGIFNATAPKPVSNHEFTQSLGKAIFRPTLFPVPEFVLKIIFGEGSTVLTGSKEIYPKAIMENGFEFKYKTIDESLKHLLD